MEQAKRKRGRPPSFDREAALDAATDLFWRHGYEGTSIADLTARTGVTAPTLYAAFGSKSGLYKAVFARYRLRREGRRVESGVQKNTLFELLEHHLREAAMAFAGSGGPAGCLVALSALQAGRESTCAQQIAASERISDLDDLIARIHEAKRLGELPDAIDPVSLGRFYAAVHQGMAVQSVDGATTVELNDIVDFALSAWPRKNAPAQKP